MKSVFNRTALVGSLQSTYAQPTQITANLADSTMPPDLAAWLTGLSQLQGVPFNYLVPDEAMLPPESLRFFYLDQNWISALLDGAMSIGRNLSTQDDTPELNLQRAVFPGVAGQIKAAAPRARAAAFGQEAPEVDTSVISGFVMRSSLVLDYPGMGFNIYAQGHTPIDPQPELLPILRLERLGPTSDTLICLVAGDAYRVDIHESPQTLHYGIDCFNDGCLVQGKAVTAVKNLHTFGNTTATENGVTTNAVTMSQNVIPTDISNCFRTASPRVLSLDLLAQRILEVNKASTPPPGTTVPSSIDSAEMGFEMTEGVGMVSFIKSTT